MILKNNFLVSQNELDEMGFYTFEKNNSSKNDSQE